MEEQGYEKQDGEIKKAGQETPEKPFLAEAFSHEKTAGGAGEDVDDIDGHLYLAFFEAEFVEGEGYGHQQDS